MTGSSSSNNPDQKRMAKHLDAEEGETINQFKRRRKDFRDGELEGSIAALRAEIEAHDKQVADAEEAMRNATVMRTQRRASLSGSSMLLEEVESLQCWSRRSIDQVVSDIWEQCERVKRNDVEEMTINQVLNGHWVEHERAEQGDGQEYAWDDVNNIPLPIDKVRAARKEEMQYTMNRKFEVVKKSEA